METAIAALAKKVAPHLMAAETTQVTSRNLTSLPASDLKRAQAALERELRKRVRNPTPVEVGLTISENARGYLLIAEIKRTEGTVVEMIDYHPDPPAAPVRPALAIARKLLWEQDAQILDLALANQEMLVLDPMRLTRYELGGSRWQPMEAVNVASVVRDPRGRVELKEDSIRVMVPGLNCAGTWRPMLTLQCQPGGDFTASRNTIDLHDWRGVFWNSTEIGGATLVAEVDGRIHIYDEAHIAQGVFDGWGSDFVAITSECGTHIAATSTGDRQSPDSIALYDLVNRIPVRVSEPVEFRGPVTALWPTSDGALAVAQNLETGKYAAYKITLDCGR